MECVLRWPVTEHMSSGAIPACFRVVMVVALKQWLVYFVDRLAFSDILPIICPRECFPIAILSYHLTLHSKCGFGLWKNAEHCGFSLLKCRLNNFTGHFSLWGSAYIFLLCSSTFISNPDLVFSTSL